MRKVAFALLSLLLFTVTGNAQTINSGSLDEVFSEGTLNIIIDYSRASIKGYSEDELLDANINLTKEWIEGKNYLLERFIDSIKNGFNTGLKSSPLSYRKAFNLRVGVFKDAHYSFVLYPGIIQDNGTLTATAEVVDDNGTTIAEITNIKGNGGRFGSYVNLVGDGLESAGDKIGILVEKASFVYWKKNK